MECKGAIVELSDPVDEDLEFLSYFDDGVNIPFDDKWFDTDQLLMANNSVDSTPSEQADDQLNACDLLPHEWFKKISNLCPREIDELFDEDPALDDENSNDINLQQVKENAQAECGDDEESKLLGWTEEDNRVYREIICEAFKKCPVDSEQRVKWSEITKMYNVRTGQNRTRIQLYSHFRYAIGSYRKPCYLKAEEETMLALNELGIQPVHMIQFLMTERSEHQLAAKIQRLKDSNRAKALKGTNEYTFRKRVQEVIVKNGGVIMFLEKKIPKKVVYDIRHLVKTNPHLRKRYNALKRAGRPKKETKMVPVTLKLKTLFRPFVYVNKRRRRTNCMPGDGRRYGLSLFCLNRLLGSPLELSKMPADEAEALEAGVDKADMSQYKILRELMALHAQKTEALTGILPKELQELPGLKPGADQQDRDNYYSNPDGRPPVVSVLPPTLYTITGLCGLLCYRATLMATIEENEDEEEIIPSELGCKETDKKLELFMMSLFQMPFNLSEAYGTVTENSDGETDSDDEICFMHTNPPGSEIAVEIQEVNPTEEVAQPADAISLSEPNLPREQPDEIEEAMEKFFRDNHF